MHLQIINVEEIHFPIHLTIIKRNRQLKRPVLSKVGHLRGGAWHVSTPLFRTNNGARKSMQCILLTYIFGTNWVTGH